MDLFCRGWWFPLLVDHSVRVSAGGGESGQGGGASGHGGVTPVVHLPVAAGTALNFVNLVVDARPALQGTELYRLRVPVAGRAVLGNFLQGNTMIYYERTFFFFLYVLIYSCREYNMYTS